MKNLLRRLYHGNNGNGNGHRPKPVPLPDKLFPSEDYKSLDAYKFALVHDYEHSEYNRVMRWRLDFQPSFKSSTGFFQRSLGASLMELVKLPKGVSWNDSAGLCQMWFENLPSPAEIMAAVEYVNLEVTRTIDEYQKYTAMEKIKEVRA